MSTESYPFCGDHRVLFQSRSRKLLLLNPTAGWIWEAHQSGDSIACMADALATPETPVARLRADITQCLASWRTQGLLDGVTTAVSPSVPNTHSPAKTQPPAVWRYRMTLQLCDRVIDLRMTDKRLYTALRPILEHLELPDVTSSNHNLDCWRSHQRHTLITVDGVLLERVCSADALIARTLYQLVELAYRRDDDLAILHASAVGDEEGALLLAGLGGSGKTTLAAQLQTQGLTYLCDDVSPLTRHGRLRPVAMSQAIKAGSWPVLEKRRPEITRALVYPRFSQQVRFLPPLTGDRDAWKRTWPVKALLFPRYHPESRGEWRPLDPLASLQQLLQTQSIYSDRVAPLLRLIEETPAFALHYAGFEQANNAIQQILAHIDATKKIGSFHTTH